MKVIEKLSKWLFRKGHEHYVEAEVPQKNSGSYRWGIRYVRYLYICGFQIYSHDVLVTVKDNEREAQAFAEYRRIIKGETRQFQNSEDEISDLIKWRDNSIILKSVHGGPDI